MAVENNCSYKVLVVEDDELLCDLIIKNLQRSGFQTEKASTGNEAITRLTGKQNVLLILDYQLPDMTGKQLIESLSQDQIQAPFIIMTGQNDVKIAVDMMKHNARDYLVKDVNFIDLLPTAVRQTIDQLDIEKRLAEAEESLKESEEEFRGIFEKSPIGIAVFGSDGNIVDANKSCLSIYGVSDISILKQRNFFSDFDIPEDVRDKLNKGQMIRYEATFHKETGVIYLDISVTPLGIDSVGSLSKYLVHIQDVTERTNAELLLQKMRDELEIKVKERTVQLAKVNEELLHEISDRKEVEKKLASNNAELQLFAEVSSELVSNTVENANRMRSLLNALLNYSQIGIESDYFQITDCKIIFDNAVSELKLIIDETKSVITNDPLPVITADNTQMKILFRSLIENAIKFHSDEPPRIHISSEQNDDEWIFSIRDNGIGIAPEYKDLIFTIFSSLQNGEGYSGTGIGLATCKKIIDSHSGRIWVESQHGKGSTFYFAIPKR
jgi:PAS domain S-box-containing protein